jgi:hypothetical protein
LIEGEDVEHGGEEMLLDAAWDLQRDVERRHD